MEIDTTSRGDTGEEPSSDSLSKSRRVMGDRHCYLIATWTSLREKTLFHVCMNDLRRLN